MIEFLCTIAGLVAGMAIIASLVSTRQDQASLYLEKTLDLIDAENMHGVANDLQSLSQQVFSNVQAHSDKVESINSSLVGSCTDVPEKLMFAINEIISANRDMQAQLIEAQTRMAQLSEMIEQTTRQARTDSLTGLANRRALDEHLNSRMEEGHDETIVGLLLMDIDRFKNFNDTYGHATGDGVLKCFARGLAKICGENAFPARYGGEEFAVVIVSESSFAMAQQAAKIRKFVSEQRIVHDDLELNITASGGLCILGNSDDLRSAYERSDEGLYMAKENGRDQGFWLSDEGWEPFPDVSVASLMPEGDSLHEVLEMDPDTEQDLENDAALQVGRSTVTCVELNIFVERVTEQLRHLQRTDLPAGCIMIEALGIDLDGDCLQNMVTIASQKLRGIDFACIYRPMTLCLFLPGCPTDAVIQRACELLMHLNRELDSWVSETIPDQFAIGVGHSLENEEAAPMLNRIEQALDEACDASPSELVVHTGHSTYFQQV
jgi:diguanylate cyclase (GGDEF)-like protein